MSTRRRPTRPAAVAVAAAGAAFVLAACGGGDGGSGEDGPDPVSDGPPDFCLAVAERRDLAANLPDFGFSVRNADVDNFNGNNGAQCNERQIVYWGPPPVVAGGNRVAVSVRLFFTTDPENGFELADGPRKKGRSRDIDGTEVVSTPGKGEYGLRFVTDSAVVNATIGCVPEDQTLGVSGCTAPVLARSDLARRARVVSNGLVPELTDRL